jgi:hypothetical protein
MAAITEGFNFFACLPDLLATQLSFENNILVFTAVCSEQSAEQRSELTVTERLAGKTERVTERRGTA